MNLLERLPEKDKTQLSNYLADYSKCGERINPCDIDYFLRFWAPAKEPFYRAFGEQFILSKDIEFDRPAREMRDEMEDVMVYQDVEAIKFRKAFCSGIRKRLNASDDWEMVYELENFVSSWSMLVDNTYTGKGFTIPGEYTVDNKPLRINRGCKVVKVLAKIVDALGIPKAGYEEFRRAHSLVLNQKKIRGKLCLSIHPLDYLTMSDNECGWTSCMSWMEEPGDYRLGTIEMMNSQSVVVAYVEAKDQIFAGGYLWNNKRWRQLYVVDESIILGNRQYPFVNDMIQGTAIKWLRDLMTPMVGWGPYAQEMTAISNRNWNRIAGYKDVYFNFDCGFMYNDIYDTRMAFVADQKFENDTHFDFNFSGPAVCTVCGGLIELGSVDANTVICLKCNGQWKCEYCGDIYGRYDDYYVVDGLTICDWCYHHELEQCEICGEVTMRANHVYIQIFSDKYDKTFQTDFNYNYYVAVCDNCDPQDYEPLFGKMYDRTDYWGHSYKAFNLAEIIDEGLRTDAGFSKSQIKLLKALRDAKSDEDRLELIKKEMY